MALKRTSFLNATDMHKMTNGVPNFGDAEPCPCEALTEILRQQGLTFDEFLTAAERAPDDLNEFVQMTNSPRN